MIEVWCQGGEADGQRLPMRDEPPDVIRMKRDPFHPGRWIRVVGPWEDAIPYERVRSVEQLDNERIYYPVRSGEDHAQRGESPSAEATGPRSASSIEHAEATAQHGKGQR